MAKTKTPHTRFHNTPGSGTRPVTRATRFAPKPSKEVAQPTTPKTATATDERPKVRRHRGGVEQLATDVAERVNDDLDPDEKARRELIRQRNKRRRTPWLVALAIVGPAELMYWIGRLIHHISGEAQPHWGLVTATIPVLVIGTAALYHRKTHQHWMPEFAFAALAGVGLAYWIGSAGASWTAALATLLVTVIGGTRWWQAHPIGPGIARLEIPKPPAPPAPTPIPRDPEADDPYCIAWRDNNASGEGKIKGSRLTGRTETEFTVSYDIELKRGVHTLRDLIANRGALAGGLGHDVEEVLFKRAPRGSGAHKARLTIITKDPVANTRLWTGPTVNAGVIKNVARFIDGSGEIDITMWDDGGTVPTMVVGSTGGGKSQAANILTTAALSTGVLNLLYADPKGNSSTALASRARVAVIGESNVLKLPWLVTAMLAARGVLAAELGADQLFPTNEVPGWMFLHDEYSLIANDNLAQRVWTKSVNIIRAYGIWGVALNQSQGQPQWGSDHARSAWASQVVAFRVNSKSGSDLVPGLMFDPNDLPVDDKGRPVPGMAVHAHYDTPTRWDHLPSEANAERMAAQGQPAPPYTTTTAFDTFFNQPHPHPLDVAAINAILGPAVDGRWQVGGRSATHEFPEDLEELMQAGSTKPQQAKLPWGQRLDPARTELTPAQAEVLGIIRNGITATGDIIDAAKAGKSSVADALNVLTRANLIRKLAHGNYEAVAT